MPKDSSVEPSTALSGQPAATHDLQALHARMKTTLNGQARGLLNALSHAKDLHVPGALKVFMRERDLGPVTNARVILARATKLMGLGETSFTDEFHPLWQVLIDAYKADRLTPAPIETVFASSAFALRDPDVLAAFNRANDYHRRVLFAFAETATAKEALAMIGEKDGLPELVSTTLLANAISVPYPETEEGETELKKKLRYAIASFVRSGGHLPIGLIQTKEPDREYHWRPRKVTPPSEEGEELKALPAPSGASGDIDDMDEVFDMEAFQTERAQKLLEAVTWLTTSAEIGLRILVGYMATGATREKISADLDIARPGVDKRVTRLYQDMPMPTFPSNLADLKRLRADFIREAAQLSGLFEFLDRTPGAEGETAAPADEPTDDAGETAPKPTDVSIEPVEPVEVDPASPPEDTDVVDGTIVTEDLAPAPDSFREENVEDTTELAGAASSEAVEHQPLEGTDADVVTEELDATAGRAEEEASDPEPEAVATPSAMGPTVEQIAFLMQSVFSPREQQLFHLMGEGLDDRQVAERMALSIDSIRALRSGCRNKLGLPLTVHPKREPELYKSAQDFLRAAARVAFPPDATSTDPAEASASPEEAADTPPIVEVDDSVFSPKVSQEQEHSPAMAKAVEWITACTEKRTLQLLHGKFLGLPSYRITVDRLGPATVENAMSALYRVMPLPEFTGNRAEVIKARAAFIVEACRLSGRFDNDNILPSPASSVDVSNGVAESASSPDASSPESASIEELLVSLASSEEAEVIEPIMEDPEPVARVEPTDRGVAEIEVPLPAADQEQTEDMGNPPKGAEPDEPFTVDDIVAVKELLDQEWTEFEARVLTQLSATSERRKLWSLIESSPGAINTSLGNIGIRLNVPRFEQLERCDRIPTRLRLMRAALQLRLAEDPEWKARVKLPWREAAAAARAAEKASVLPPPPVEETAQAEPETPAPIADVSTILSLGYAPQPGNYPKEFEVLTSLSGTFRKRFTELTAEGFVPSKFEHHVVLPNMIEVTMVLMTR